MSNNELYLDKELFKVLDDIDLKEWGEKWRAGLVGSVLSTFAVEEPEESYFDSDWFYENKGDK